MKKLFLATMFCLSPLTSQAAVFDLVSFSNAHLIKKQAVAQKTAQEANRSISTDKSPLPVLTGVLFPVPEQEKQEDVKVANAF